LELIFLEYTEVSIKTTTLGAEALCARLDMLDVGGYAIYDKNDFKAYEGTPANWDYIDEDQFEKMPDYVLVKTYVAANENASEKTQIIHDMVEWFKHNDLGIDMGTLEVTLKQVADSDWENEWKKYYKPLPVGSRLLIVPCWEDTGAPEPDRIKIIIDPGMAFGSGTHETTFMCMELLEEYVKPGDSVFDVGCGTGILAVTAVKLGAHSALALDRDDFAIETALTNAGINGVSGQIEIRKNDLLNDIGGQADLIVANIIADVIIDFASDAFRHLKEGGIFIASGIIKQRAEDVQSAICSAGFKIAQIRYKGEWAAVAAMKIG